MQALSTTQKDFWSENGYLVISNVIPELLLRNVVNTIEDFIGKRMDEPADWYKAPMYPGGIIHMNHHQSFWETRQHPNLHMIFSDIWGTEKLSVSQDRANMNPPTSDRWDHNGTIHWDIDSKQLPLSFHVQGLLVLSDTAEDQGGFQCVPGFHKQLEAWAKNQPSDRPARRPDTKGMEIRNIPASAGDFIIWHSGLPHGNSRNYSNLPRLCQYITMNPAKTPFRRSDDPLVQTPRSEIAKILGLPEGLLENWLRKQHESDLVIVTADSVKTYDLIPDLIRIQSGRHVNYVPNSWGQIIDPNNLQISRQYALATDLEPSRDSPHSEELIKKAIIDIPKPRFEPVLSKHELDQLPEILITQRKSCKHIWSIEEISTLIKREFGITTDTRKARLTPLGRKLANVDPW